ncbi:NAD(P)/FAD-dependent oxidoreductase [Actinomadura roseirufa]|uniref:NAD(P)/FAD-dependent oxidoreductase n=1 Tax=Actinomadura roseirufa TaxID=2094049 RepID=UPI001A955C60|nr:FAD-binding oxidoreductase [Actinomadura roseirufa]
MTRAGTGPKGTALTSADAAVIGGGVIGLSVACHLAEAGVGTVLLERDELGSGASRATADMVRTFFPGNPVSSAMAVRSLAVYRSFEARTGVALPLRRVGYLVVYTTREQIAAFEADLPAQRAAGVDVALVGAAEARRRNPLLGGLDVLAAAWSPDAYVSDTAAIVGGFAAAARRAGARLLTGRPVTAVDTTAGRLDTPAGPVRAGAVICAAGAWSAPLARSAGVDLPFTEPVEQELLTTGDPPPGVVVPGIPMTLVAASGLLVRKRGNGLLVGMGYPGPERDGWRARVRERLDATYPALAGVELRTAFTGVRDASPDRTAFIGRLPGATPFLYAAGFSGHGLCTAPAAGELVRDLYFGREPEVDARRLAAGPERV